MSVDDFIDFVEKPSQREKIALGAYLLVLAFLAVPITRMAGFAWQSHGISRTIVESFMGAFGLNLEEFSIIIFGLYLGLLFLILVDTKKRWQGVLLSIGTVISLFVLAGLGMFIPVVDFTSNIHFLILGGLMGIGIGAIPQLKKLDTAEAYEFREASKIIFILLSVIVVISYLEFHLVYNNPFNGAGSGQGFGFYSEYILTATIASVLFIGILWRFIQYDADKLFLVLGPRQSGKSLLLIASFLEAKKRQEGKSKLAKTPLQPSGDLMDQLRELESNTEGWGVQATDMPSILHFKYVHGTIFPRNIEIGTIDYPGEILPAIPKQLGGEEGTGPLSEVMPDGGERQEEITYVESGEAMAGDSKIGGGLEEELTEGGMELVSYLAKLAYSSDTLILVIDVEKYLDGEDMGLEHYFGLLRRVDSKRVIPVATKSDYFAEEFVDKFDMFPQENFERFKEYVHERLTSDDQISTLIIESGGSQIQPVYYQTRKNDDGEKVPIRSKSGGVETVGFDYLLDRIGG